MDQEAKHQEAADSIVLEEEIDPNYVPSEAEVVEYAKWLGMDLEKDTDLFWIAREGLMAPLPKNWKPCKTKDTEDIYYFNFTTGESTWDHPCDGYYKKQYEEAKKKKETVAKENSDQNRSKAKQDVEVLLGKKKKSRSALLDVRPLEIPSVNSTGGGGAGVLERKPLPGITAQPRLNQSASPVMMLPRDSLSTDRAVLGGSLGGSIDSLPSKSRASSKLLAAVASEGVAESKPRSLVTTSLDSKHDSKADTDLPASTSRGLVAQPAALSSSSPSNDARGSRGGASDCKSSSPPSPSRGDAKSPGDAQAEASSGRTDLGPLFARNRQLPSASSRSSSPVPALSPVAQSDSRTAEELTDARDEIRRLRADLVQERERAVRVQDDYRDEISRICSARDAAVADTKRRGELDAEQARSESEQLRVEVSELRRQVDDRTSSITSLRNDLARRDQELNSAVADRNSSQSQLAEMSAEIARLTAELQTRSRELVETQRAVASSRVLEAECRRCLSEAEESLELERAKYARLDEALGKTISAQKRTISELQVSLNIASRCDTGLALSDNSDAQAVVALQSEIRDLTASLTSRDADVQALTAERDALRSQVQRVSDELQQGKASALAAADELSESAGKLRTVEAENAALKERIGEMLSSMQQEVDRNSAQRAELTQRVDSMTSEIRALEQRAADLQQDLTQALARNEQLNATLASSIAQAAQGQADVSSDFTAQIRQLTAHVDQAEAAKKEARLRADELGASLSLSQASLAESNHTVQRLTAELAQVRREKQLSSASEALALAATQRECEELRSSALQAVEAERVLGEKRARSYQEEILQLQKRLAATLAESADRQPSEQQLHPDQAACEGNALHLELAQSRSVVASISAALSTLEGVVAAKEESIAALNAQLSEARAAEAKTRALPASLSASVIAGGDRSDAALVAENQLAEAKDKLAACEQRLQAIIAKQQSTANLLASAEAECEGNYKKWQDAESRMLKAKAVQHAASVDLAAQLQATTEDVDRLRAENRTLRQQCDTLRGQLRESEHQCEVYRTELVEERALCARLWTELSETLRKRATAVNATDSATSLVASEAAVASSDSASLTGIVELSLALGRQQAGIQRLEERLQSIQTAAVRVAEEAPLMTGVTEELMVPASSAVQRQQQPQRNVQFVDQSKASRRVSHSNQRTAGQRTGGSTKTSFKAEYASDSNDNPPSTNFSPWSQSSSTSESDLALQSLLRSPVEAWSAVDGGDETGAAVALRKAVHKMESLPTLSSEDVRGRNSFKRLLSDAASACKSERQLVSELSRCSSLVKRALHTRQERVAELKAQWKAGRGSCHGSSSLQINEMTSELNTAVDQLRRLQRRLSDREVSVKRALLLAEKGSSLLSALDEDDGDMQSLKTCVTTLTRILADLAADRRSIASATERCLASCDQAPISSRGADYETLVGPRKREPTRRKKAPHLLPTSFDDSYVDYDRHRDWAADSAWFGAPGRHQVVDRYYSEGRHFPTTGAHLANRGFVRDAVAISADFSRPQTQTLDQRRVLAQHHIAKIERQQSNTFRECEDHVRFLDRMRRELVAVSHTSSNAPCVKGGQSELAVSDRENRINERYAIDGLLMTGKTTTRMTRLFEI